MENFSRERPPGRCNEGTPAGAANRQIHGGRSRHFPDPPLWILVWLRVYGFATAAVDFLMSACNIGP